MKFYPRDWRGDQALRAVSIGARGLWMECLCIMHEASPRGHLLLNGKPVGGGALARMAGVSVEEARSLMGELQDAGVFSVTRAGVVFSRRMTKDHARAQKGKASAKKRWNDAASSSPQAPDTVTQSGAPNGFPNGEPSTQKPEARDQSSFCESRGASARDPDPPPKPPDLFPAFYDAYGVKLKRADAEKAWLKAVRLKPAEELVRIAAEHRAHYHATGRNQPYPASWLNGSRWNDKLSDIRPFNDAKGSPDAGHAPRHQSVADRRQDEARKRTDSFLARIAADPGSPG